MRAPEKAKTTLGHDPELQQQQKSQLRFPHSHSNSKDRVKLRDPNDSTRRVKHNQRNGIKRLVRIEEMFNSAATLFPGERKSSGRDV